MRGEEGMRESERRFRSMLGDVELASVTLDRDARITSCNDVLPRLTGWEREEVVGQDWFERFIAHEPAYGKEYFARRIDGADDAWHRENRILTRDGEVIRMWWHSVLLRSASG